WLGSRSWLRCPRCSQRPSRRVPSLPPALSRPKTPGRESAHCHRGTMKALAEYLDLLKANNLVGRHAVAGFVGRGRAVATLEAAAEIGRAIQNTHGIAWANDIHADD